MASNYVGNIPAFSFFLLYFMVNFYFNLLPCFIKMVFIILPNGTTGGSVQEKLTFPLETLRKTLKYFNVNNSIFSS
jgi:hypothetical protein